MNLLSTFCDPTIGTTIESRTGRELINVPCPEVLPVYLRTMRGADVFAQRQSYSKVGCRSKKWFYSLIWFLLDTAVHNAYILYQKRFNKQSYTEKDFRKELMQQLVGSFTSRLQPQRAGRASGAVKRGRTSVHPLSLLHYRYLLSVSHAGGVVDTMLGVCGNAANAKSSCVCQIATTDTYKHSQKRQQR